MKDHERRGIHRIFIWVDWWIERHGGGGEGGMEEWGIVRKLEVGRLESMRSVAGYIP